MWRANRLFRELPKGEAMSTPSTTHALSTRTTTAAGIVAAALALQLAAPALRAQSKTIPGDTVRMTATVEAIDHQRRVLTIKDTKGNYHEMEVPASVQRFDSIKVGDKLNATYYDNIILRVKAPGEKDVNTGASATVPTPGSRPSGTVSKQRTITATIVAIDQAVPSISFKGPNGWAYSSKVEDKDALKKVKVGDKVDITWTEAMLVSFEPVK